MAEVTAPVKKRKADAWFPVNSLTRQNQALPLSSLSVIDSVRYAISVRQNGIVGHAD